MLGRVILKYLVFGARCGVYGLSFRIQALTFFKKCIAGRIKSSNMLLVTKRRLWQPASIMRPDN